MTTTTRDERALLAAIAAQPEEDTPRLVYADCLQESGEPERMDRAELIRVQIDLERSPGNWNEARQEIKNRKLLGQFSNDQAAILLAITETYPSPQHLRERELLNDHPDWLRVTCPACGGKKGYTNPTGGFKEFSGSYPRWESCKFCSGTGHLPLTFRRGFPWRVTVPTLAQVGAERDVWVRRESVGGQGGTTLNNRVTRFVPTTPARELLRSLPTVGELVPGDKKPMEHEGKYAFVCGVLDHPCGLPESLWRTVHRDGPHPTADAAISALGATLAGIVRSAT